MSTIETVVKKNKTFTLHGAQAAAWKKDIKKDTKDIKNTKDTKDDDDDDTPLVEIRPDADEIAEAGAINTIDLVFDGIEAGAIKTIDEMPEKASAHTAASWKEAVAKKTKPSMAQAAKSESIQVPAKATAPAKQPTMAPPQQYLKLAPVPPQPQYVRDSVERRARDRGKFARLGEENPQQRHPG